MTDEKYSGPSLLGRLIFVLCHSAGEMSPSFILPASLIISWFQGGSHTRSTLASSTPGIAKIFNLASWAMAGPIPQPGAVKVILTSTWVSPSDELLTRQS